MFTPNFSPFKTLKTFCVDCCINCVLLRMSMLSRNGNIRNVLTVYKQFIFIALSRNVALCTNVICLQMKTGFDYEKFILVRPKWNVIHLQSNAKLSSLYMRERLLINKIWVYALNPIAIIKWQLIANCSSIKILYP